MWKRMIIMLLIVGAIFGGLFGYKAFGRHMMNQYFAHSKQPPVSVAAMRAEKQSWQERLKAVGNIQAVQGIELASEVSGVVQEVLFKSGTQVKAGQVLLRLNAETDIAQLRVLQAAVDLARTVYERDRKQLAIQAVSQSQVDGDAAELKSRRAQIVQQMSVISKKFIRVPFAGQIGISSVNPGQYLNPGEKIVTLQALDLVYVDMYLPQQVISKIYIGQKVDVMSDAYPGKIFSGQVTAISPKVDQGSRNILIQTSVPNPKHELLPGMFVSVELESGDPQPYITIPQSAVAFNPYGETVYVIEGGVKDADGKTTQGVKQVFITVGDARGDQVAVTSGLKENDLVVISGQHKLNNTSTVIINDKVQPQNDADPRPVDQ